MRPNPLWMSLAFLAPTVAPLVAQESAAVFDTPVVVLPVDSAPFQKLLDFDGDGDLDAVGHKMTSGTTPEITVQAWENDGSGRYALVYEDVAPAPSFVTSYVPMRLAIADFNGDGRQDFALGGGALTWRYVAAPAGGFTKSALSMGGSAALDVLAADFDGDGGVDLFALTDGGAQVFWSDGSLWSYQISAFASAVVRVILTETDGDALPDVVGVGPLGLVPLAFTESSGGKWIAAYPEHFVPETTTLADSADIDLDGDEDVVYFGPASYHVLRRTGPASWVMEAPAPGGPAEYLADIDLDGDPDGVCCGGGGGGGGGPGTYPQLDFSSMFEIAMNDGGTFAPAFGMEGLGSKSLAGAADVDGDGDVDLVAGRCVYFARGGPPEPAPYAKLTMLPPLAFVEQFEDWDTDGDVDVTLYVGPNPWRNQGDGSFAAGGNWPWNVNPPGTTTSGPWINGDFDGDGDVDVVKPLYQVQPSGGPTFLYMYLWRNQAGAGLVPWAQAAPAGVSFLVGAYAYSPESALVRDADGDGDLDIAMRTYGDFTSKHSWIYANDGSGYFAPAENWPGERIEELTDFDGDGRPDALVATNALFQPQALRLRLGTGGPAGSMFAPAQDVFGGVFVHGDVIPVEVADFNQDGFADVAAALQGSLNVQLFLNPAPFGLGPSWVLANPIADALAASSGRIHGFDADLDGFTDLIVGYAESAPNARTVYRLKPSAAGAVLTSSSYEPGVTQVLNGLYPGDFDGDGDVDFGGEYIARNAVFHGPDAGFRQQYGANNAGSGGYGPILGAKGPFRVGEPVDVRLRGASPGSVTFLDVAPSKATYAGFPTPQTTCWIDVFSPALVKFAGPSGGIPGAAGTGGYTVPVNVTAGMVGPQFELQAFVIDFGAPGYVTATNGLSLRFGP